MLANRSRPSARGFAFAALVVAAVLIPAVFVALQVTAPEQVEGFVMNVRTKAPLGVESFDLLAGDGRTLTFEIGQLDVSNGFDAGHLVTHQLTLQPVIVTYHRDGSRLLAVKLADGHLPSGGLPSVPVPTSS